MDLGSQFMKVAIVKVTMTLNIFTQNFFVINTVIHCSLNVAYKTITAIRNFGREEKDNNDNTVMFMRLLH